MIRAVLYFNFDSQEQRDTYLAPYDIGHLPDVQVFEPIDIPDAAGWHTDILISPDDASLRQTLYQVPGYLGTWDPDADILIHGTLPLTPYRKYR